LRGYKFIKNVNVVILEITITDWGLF